METQLLSRDSQLEVMQSELNETKQGLDTKESSVAELVNEHQ